MHVRLRTFALHQPDLHALSKDGRRKIFGFERVLDSDILAVSGGVLHAVLASDHASKLFP